MSKANKKPKDPNAPKKSQSSYFIFSNERRVALQAENKGKSVTEISKIISAEWKSMDAATKKSYDDRAAEAKKKYQIDLAEYQKTDSFKKYQRKLAEWKESASEPSGRSSVSSKASPKGKKKGKAPKKPKQPESMPKRPQSSYFIFGNERRNELKMQYPDKKITELSKLIADEWKVKSAEEKKAYEQQSEVNKEQYAKDIAAYKKTEEYQNYTKKLENWKKETKKWKSDVVDSDEEGGGVKVSMPRKPKDEKCPKKPLTSYFLYAQEVRERTKAENPNKAITEIAKEISKKWKELSEDDKKPYIEEAARLKEQYEKDIDEYRGSDAQKAFEARLEAWKQECDARKQAAIIKSAKKKSSASKKASPKKKGKESGKKKSNKMDEDDDESDESSEESASGDESDGSSSSESGSDSDDDSSSDESE